MKRSAHKKEHRLRLSLDTPFLVIYWSLTMLAFFSAIISIFEMQRVNMLTVFFLVLVLVLVVLSRSSFLYFLDNQLVFSYFFGLKKTSLLFEDVHQTIITDKRHFHLIDKKASPVYSFYLAKKDGQLFCSQLKQKNPLVVMIHKQKMA